MEMMIREKLHYKSLMLEMFSPCFTVDEDIIKKYQNEFPQIGSEDLIHQGLECGRSISETKGHDQKLIVAIMCVESYFRDIIRMDPNLVIPGTKIQLGEKMSTMELIQKLINNGNWKLIFDCDVIKCSKFDAEVPLSIFFLDKKNR